MIEENKCVLCEAEFNSGHLVDGICKDCKKLYPGAKTKDDLKKDKAPEVESHEALIKELVTKQVDNILEKYGILQKCECGNLFHKRSPAQKHCGRCTTKEVK